MLWDCCPPARQVGIHEVFADGSFVEENDHPNDCGIDTVSSCIRMSRVSSAAFAIRKGMNLNSRRLLDNRDATADRVASSN